MKQLLFLFCFAKPNEQNNRVLLFDFCSKILLQLFFRHCLQSTKRQVLMTEQLQTIWLFLFFTQQCKSLCPQERNSKHRHNQSFLSFLWSEHFRLNFSSYVSGENWSKLVEILERKKVPET